MDMTLIARARHVLLTGAALAVAAGFGRGVLLVWLQLTRSCTVIFGWGSIRCGGCRAYGLPDRRVSSPDRSGGATRSPTLAPRLVTLAAGATANALLRVPGALNYPSATCGRVTATYLNVCPPNQTQPVHLTLRTTGCSKSTVKLLSVGVVTAGAGNAG